MFLAGESLPIVFEHRQDVYISVRLFVPSVDKQHPEGSGAWWRAEQQMVGRLALQ